MQSLLFSGKSQTCTADLFSGISSQTKVPISSKKKNHAFKRNRKCSAPVGLRSGNSVHEAWLPNVLLCINTVVKWLSVVTSAVCAIVMNNTSMSTCLMLHDSDHTLISVKSDVKTEECNMHY